MAEFEPRYFLYSKYMRMKWSLSWLPTRTRFLIVRADLWRTRCSGCPHRWPFLELLPCFFTCSWNWTSSWDHPFHSECSQIFFWVHFWWKGSQWWPHPRSYQLLTKPQSKSSSHLSRAWSERLFGKPLWWGHGIFTQWSSHHFYQQSQLFFWEFSWLVSARFQQQPSCWQLF